MKVMRVPGIIPVAALLVASLASPASGETAAPAGTQAYTAADTASKRLLRTVRKLAARGKWEEAFLLAQQSPVHRCAPSQEPFVEDLESQGVHRGARRALLDVFLEAPPDVRAGLRSRGRAAFLDAYRKAAQRRDPEALLRAAGTQPFLQAGEPARRLASDLLLETGRFLEAEWVLSEVDRRSRGDVKVARRLRFARRRLAASESGFPESAEGLRCLRTIEARGPGPVEIGSEKLHPVFLAGAVPSRDGVALSFPQGILLASREPEEDVRLPGTGQWVEGPSEASGFPLGDRGDAGKGRTSLFPVTKRGERCFSFEGVRVLPGERRGGRWARSRTLVAWRLEEAEDKRVRLWRRKPEEILDGARRGRAYFHSAPLAGAGRVWILVAERSRSPAIHLVCLDAETGTVNWRRFLVALTGERRGFLGVRFPSFPPRGEMLLAGGVLYVQTNAGFLAGIRARDGSPVWGHRYRRRDFRPLLRRGRFLRLAVLGSFPDWAQLGAPLAAGSRIVFCPWDSPLITAVERGGVVPEVVWNAAEWSGVKNLTSVVGAYGSKLILAVEDRLFALDGDRGWAPSWTLFGADATGGSGFRGRVLGRAVFAGSRCFFGTTRGVYLLDCERGRLVNGGKGAYCFGWSREEDLRLHAAGDLLVAAGTKTIRIFEVK